MRTSPFQFLHLLFSFFTHKFYFASPLPFLLFMYFNCMLQLVLLILCWASFSKNNIFPNMWLLIPYTEGAFIYKVSIQHYEEEVLNNMMWKKSGLFQISPAVIIVIHYSCYWVGRNKSPRHFFFIPVNPNT